MSASELIRARSNNPNALTPKMLRKEVRARLDMHLDFEVFLNNANDFLDADETGAELGWRDEFIKSMGESNQQGLRKLLNIEQWGLILNHHHWYFGSSLSRAEDAMPDGVMEEIYLSHFEYLKGYDNAYELIDDYAETVTRYRVDKLRQQFIGSVIVLDIECSDSSDESPYKEICYSFNGEYFSWEAGSVEELNDYLLKLEERAQGKWLAGHNIILWDLPKLRQYMGNNYLGGCSIWDTLIVQSILEPWLVSQALVGAEKAHQADADVRETTELLLRQIQAIPMDPASLVSAQLSPEEFTEKICCALQAKPSARSLVQEPSFISTCPRGAKKILIPEVALSETYWVPGITYHDDLKNSRTLPAKETATASPIHNIAHVILLNLIDFAQDRRVDLLEEMLPAWLLMHVSSSELSEWLKTTAQPTEDPNARILQTYECLNQSELETNRLAMWHEPYPQLRKSSLLRKLGQTLMPSALKEQPDAYDLSRQIHKLDVERLNATLPGAQRDSELWCDYHPSRWMLKKPWNIVDARLCRTAPVYVNEGGKPTRKRSPRVRLPNFHMAERRWQPVSAGSSDRFSYWKDVVAQVSAILKHSSRRSVVHIVLLQDSAEVQAVDRLFAMLQWAPGYGRSRFQRLNSIKGEESGKCLVGNLRDVPFWRKAADRCGIEVEYILPELPLDYWAIAEADRAVELANAEDVQPDDTGSHSFEIENDTSPLPGDDEGNGEQGICSIRLRKSNLQREAYDFAIESNLEAWLLVVFPKHKPWILDHRVQSTSVSALCTDLKVDLRPHKQVDEAFAQIRQMLGARERKIPDHSIQNYRQFLKDVWGYDFKSTTQLPVMEEISKSNHDMFVALPTGEGKSVLFQIPALVEGMASGRLSIVISPLKALMKDQVMSLNRKGFNLSVDYLSGDLDSWELDEAHQRIIDGQTKLLFVAPERFRNPFFMDLLQRRYQRDEGFGFTIVDEAHCLWLWGVEFRPDYFYCINSLNTNYRTKPSGLRYLLFSATVTQSVFRNVGKQINDDIESISLLPADRLRPIRDFLTIVPTEFPDTSNSRHSSPMESRYKWIASVIKSSELRPRESTVIIFVQRRDQADECSARFRELLKSWQCSSFHAGLGASERERIYEDLRAGRIQLLVATKAFGMGMDIDNIHRCFHLSPPCYLEDYLQEVGRSGRNESKRKKAISDSQLDCTVLWSKSNINRNKELISGSSLSIQQLSAIHHHACESSHSTSSGQKVALIHQGRESQNANDTLLGSALGWLERSPLSRIEIMQALPHVLEVRLKDFGTSKAKDLESLGVSEALVLKALQSVVSGGSLRTESNAKASAIFVGELLEGVEDKTSWSHLIISLTGIYKFAKLNSLNEVIEILGIFVRRGVLSIERKIDFKQGGFHEYSESLFKSGISMINWVNELLASELCKITYTKLVNEAKSTLAEHGFDFSYASSEENQSLREDLPSTLVGALVSSARSAGLGIDELVDENGALTYSFAYSSATKRKISTDWVTVWETAATLQRDCFSSLDSGQVEMERLIESTPELGGWKAVKSSLGLLSKLRIVRLKQILNDPSYLVRILSEEKLLDENGDPTSTAVEQVHEELQECREFNRLRGLAMELQLRITKSSQRVSFIDDYFACHNSDDLKEVLGKWSVRLSEEDSSFEDILRHLGQERLSEEITMLKEGEEPKQHLTATLSPGQDVIVNAGPGAGKTRVLIARAVHLMHEEQVRPDQILILAFNRAVREELKRRTMEFLQEMGYGTYARHLQVHTFHSFAISNMPDEWAKIARSPNKGKGRSNAASELLDIFTKRIAESDDFTKRVGSNYRVILVDEFQDMNDSFFNLIMRLKAIGNPSLMVIGDDDQDVVRWNRPGRESPNSIEYFRKLERKLEGVDVIDLQVNFRSCDNIVKESQNRLKKLLPESGERMKSGVDLRSRSDSSAGKVNYFKLWDDGIQTALNEVETEQTCAVLCRTNSEAYQAYHELKAEAAEDMAIRLLGGADLPLRRLRHIAEFLDMARDENLGDFIVAPNWQMVTEQFDALRIPESHLDHALSLESLKKAFIAQMPNSNIGNFCEWLNQLRTLEAGRILANCNSVHEKHRRIIVSTIHKVKGLEFDSVVVMPSRANFPFDDAKEDAFNSEASSADITSRESSVADEVRLQYVAITRAKSKVWVGIGIREKSWERGEQYKGESSGGTESPIMIGSPKEMHISFPAFADKASNMQPHIRRHARVGDALRFYMCSTGRRRILSDDGSLLGQLKMEKSLSLNRLDVEIKSLQIANICRWPIEELKYQKLEELDPEYVERGWLYTLLVSGF